MAEAEDVLLDAAHHATVWVRGLWERDGGPDADLGAAVRRLERWQGAWLEHVWPVVPGDPPAPPGIVSRTLRRTPPWRARPRPMVATDGARIFVPRPWLAQGADGDRALVAALGTAWRLARGPDPVSIARRPLAREILWLVEGALGDCAIARAFPGLVAAISQLRRAARDARPSTGRLLVAERPLEQWARGLLECDADGAPTPRLGELDAEAGRPAAVRHAVALAESLATDRVRGVAPVPHWGLPGPRSAAFVAPPTAGEASGQRPATPSRSARLARPMQRAPDPETAPRPGAFAIPADDAHTTVDTPAVSRPVDQGADEDPETLAAELARLDALPRTRQDGEVREVIEGGDSVAAATPSGTVAGSEDHVTWLYPEWDTAAGVYRDPGCRVRESEARSRDEAFAERVRRERHVLRDRLRRQLDALRPRRERLRRQPEGDDVDVAGWVADWTRARAGGTPTGRVYTRERRIRRDVAVTLLLDTSGSTESWIDGRRRVIDVVKEAAIVFVEALAGLGDRHAVLSFSSQGAGDVRIRRLASFGRRSDASVQARIGALEPDAYTRLGAALRHATAGLARESERARLLLLLSDGKPQDEDGYEGEYGIEDARRAVSEAAHAGVRVFAVTVDREGASYLASIFGPHGYTVIKDAGALPERLPGIYRRLTADA